MKKIIAVIMVLNLMGLKEQYAQSTFVFEPLPYAYDALETFIDKTTMEIHYSRHHRAYFDNFIKAIADIDIKSNSIYDIFNQIDKYPAAIRNNGGGFYNHTLFWSIMSPKSTGEPKSELKKAIEKNFGSFANFKKEFEFAANTRFGSGWAWLSVDSQGNLFVSSTPNQDNPLMNIVEKRGIPILALDVWEHAYYLQYQNKRSEYSSNFWKVVNWDIVGELYEKAVKK